MNASEFGIKGQSSGSWWNDICWKVETAFDGRDMLYLSVTLS